MLSPMKLLLIGAALFILYKLMTKDKVKNTAKESKVKERKIASGELVKDPMCGTYVDTEGSITVRDGGKKYCFCSYECRQKFLDKLEESGREVPSLGKNDDDE